VRESGITRMISNKMYIAIGLGESVFEKGEEVKHFDVVRWENFAGSFYLFLIGIFLAFVALILEFCTCNYYKFFAFLASIRFIINERSRQLKESYKKLINSRRVAQVA